MDANSLSTLSAVIYDGNSNPATFVQQFKYQALFHDWDAAKQLTSLPLFLKGRAKCMYDAITTKQDIKNVLDELV